MSKNLPGVFSGFAPESLAFFRNLADRLREAIERKPAYLSLMPSRSRAAHGVMREDNHEYFRDPRPS
jgi:hypothetical protein